MALMNHRLAVDPECFVYVQYSPSLLSSLMSYAVSAKGVELFKLVRLTSNIAFIVSRVH